MTKAKLILVSLCGLLGGGILIFSSLQDKPKTDIPAVPVNDGVVSYVDTDEKPSAPKDQANAWVIDGKEFEKNELTLFETANWDTNLPDKSRFILIPHEKEIDSDQTAIIQQWIKDKKTVLFYGFDVNLEKTKEKIGLEEMEIIDVKSDYALPYLLYGYGYSEVHKQNMPVFLSSNTDQNIDGKIASFLFKESDY